MTIERSAPTSVLPPGLLDSAFAAPRPAAALPSARQVPLALRLRFAAARTAIAFRCADLLEDLHEAEIDLAPFHIHFDHLHAHLVAETINLAGVLAAHDVRTLHEAVVIVSHRGYVHHAFHEVLDELDIQTKRGDARDVTLEFIANLVRHEPDLLPLHELALGVIGPPLALRRVTRGLRQLLRQLFLAVVRHAVPRLAQRAVHDQIRIAPDGRREMRVARSRETEVSEVLRVIPRLLHRPQHQKRDWLFFGLALDALDELLEMPGTHGIGRRAQAVAQRRDELIELFDLHRVRILVDAIERWHIALVEMLRDGFVREQHEFLDDPVRDVPLGSDDLLDHALVV